MKQIRKVFVSSLISLICALTFSICLGSDKDAPGVDEGKQGETVTGVKPDAVYGNKVNTNVHKEDYNVVIRVGGKPIKQSQIDTVVDLMAKAQSENGEVTDDQKAQMKKIAATNLIGQELLDLEAHALHIVATPAEVDSLLQFFKSRFPDEATFEKTLKEAGDTQVNIKAKLAKQIRANKVLARHIQTPKPTEQEMREYLKSLALKFPVKYLNLAYRDTSPSGIY